MNLAASGSLHSDFRAKPFGPDRLPFGKHLEVVPDVTDKQSDRPAPATETHTDKGAVASGILFGPFCLLPARRLLLEGNRPVRIGSRALEILIALVEHHGELMSKSALMERVWPDTIVVEANLSVHIAALRKALRDGNGENRYLVNMPGRGYRFVAPITLAEDRKPAMLKADATQPLRHVPEQLSPSIRHGESIQELMDQLRELQLAVAGSENVGQSIAALALTQGNTDANERGIRLVDLAQLADPHETTHPVAAASEFNSRPERPLSDFLAELKHKRTLLVLDNCGVQVIHIMHWARA
jgi:DNA-binding winged helix-turn-helix (wHTH) protein